MEHPFMKKHPALLTFFRIPSMDPRLQSMATLNDVFRDMTLADFLKSPVGNADLRRKLNVELAQFRALATLYASVTSANSVSICTSFAPRKS